MPMTPVRRHRSLLAAVLGAIALLPAGCATQAPAPEVLACPQPRFTGQAPEPELSMTNPLPVSALDLRRAHALYQLSCAGCHGRHGDGEGSLSSRYTPPPRNFACAATVNGIPDGQLFWIVRNGSPGTGMPPFSTLDDDEIWHLVHYLRTLAN